jgi:hypothetical protein
MQTLVLLLQPEVSPAVILAVFSVLGEQHVELGRR